jgi:hypothetical protein
VKRADADGGTVTKRVTQSLGQVMKVHHGFVDPLGSEP